MPESARSPEKVLVTSALPYADGPIHFGHVVGAYLPADVYVRFRRQRGDEVIFVCGTDEHGVAVTLHAEQEGVGYQDYVDRWHDHQAATFAKLGIAFDIFSGTSAGRNPGHAALSQHFFQRLVTRGYVFDKVEEQLYCEVCRRFLADRYVEGTCPRCGYEKARGDECPKCGNWIDVRELINPRCKISGDVPVVRPTKHWYLDLAKLRDEKIDSWFRGKVGQWKPNVVRFVEAMLPDLRERPVTRDLPWGVPVPLPDAEGKVLYVWFDAPIGYVSITQQLFAQRGEPEAWKSWWQDPGTKLVHFIGKDNITFHVVVFPAMLYGAGEGYVLPDSVPANEFFNLEGRKFNKSAGWYIGLEDFFEHYESDAARYALIAALPETADSDFLWREFQQRVNVDLADTIGNFVSRTLRFVERYFAGKVPIATLDAPEESALLAATAEAARKIEEAILAFSFRKAAAALVELGWNANRYYDQAKPWESRTRDPESCARSIRACVEVVRSLAVLAAPFLPESAQKTWEMLGLDGRAADVPWHRAPGPALPPGELALRPVAPLFRKVTDEEIEHEIQKLRRMTGDQPAPREPEPRSKTMSEPTSPEPASQKPPTTPAPKAAPAPGSPGAAAQPGSAKPPITYDDFMKLDLRVGVVKAAEKHPNAERLLKVDVEIGTETRQIIAGIAASYDPASLVGRRVVVLANLEPKQLRGLTSSGMLLAADVDGKPLLLSPEGSPPPGTPVK